MHFGNWLITENTIEWNAEGFKRFVIPVDKLNAVRENKADNTVFYEWILLATDEDWLTQNDLYDLNYAFVYAMAKFGLDFDYNIFDDTLEEQFDQFDLEDRDDFQL